MTLAGELEAMKAGLLARDFDGDDFDVDDLDLDAVLADLCAGEPVVGDGVTGWLGEVLARVGGLATGGDSAGDAARIDRIAILERIKASVTAAQAAEIVAFGRSQVEAQRDAGVDYRRLGRGVAVFDCSQRAKRAIGHCVCERGNYVREMPGWSVRLVDDDPHTTITTTPTGHSYLSRAPDPP